MNSKLFLFILLAFSNLVAFAAEPITMTTENYTVAIQTAEFAKRGATVVIANNNGSTIHVEQLSAGTTTKKFNLANLPAGLYTMTLENHNRIINQPVFIKPTGVEIGQKIEETFKPSINVKGENIILNALTFGKATSVTLYDTEGNIITAENFIDQPTIGRVYNIAALPTGLYRMAITYNKELFTYDIKK